MIIFHRLKSFARWVFRRGEVERQLHDELESFIELTARDKIRDGVAPDEARRLARLELRGVDQTKERVRWYRWGAQLDVLLQDLRYGWRSLTRQPGFTAIVVLTLAVGIGANTAVYSVVDATLLRPLPFREPDRLMAVFLMEPSSTNGAPSRIAWSYPKYETFRHNQQVFEDAALYRTWLINLTGDGEPERLQMEEVSAGYFPLLGVEAQLGRTFLPAEDAIPEQNFVTVLSDSLWRRRFGADPSVIGRTIDLDLKPYTVVGVLPAGFQGLGSPADLWVPVHRLDSETLAQRWGHNWSLVARIKPDVRIEQAQSATTVLGKIIDEAHPDGANARTKWGAQAETLEEIRIDPTIRKSVLVLFGAVSFVLLIACVNVANLLLARGNSRKREIAIRCAIGAGRFRVVRQLLTESLMLGLLGGAASLAVAYASIYAVSVVNPFGAALALGRRLRGTLFTLNSIQLDSRVLLFTLGIAVATGVIFGLAPVFQAARGNVTDWLKRGTDPIRTRHFMAGKGILVVVEIALAFVLLVGAGLMIKSLDNLLSTRIGIDPDNILSVKLTVPAGSGGFQAVVGFFDELERRIAAQPGVISAGLSSCHALEGRALDGRCGQNIIRFSDRPKVPAGTEPTVGTLQVSPDYFKTMKIPLLRGRLFNSADREGAPLAVIVNEAAARRFWPGEDPIGKRVYVWFAAFTRGAEVVGVVGDVRYGPMDRPPQPDAYLPYRQAPSRTMTLFGRTEGDPVALVEAVRRHAGTLDRSLPIYDIKTMRQRISDATVRARFNVILLTAFAVIAMVLAAVGIYGVMSYAVRQRTREIGIRIALGARSEDVVRQVVRQAGGLILIGTAIGLAGALAATRLLSSALYEIQPHDPPIYVAIVMILVAASLLASYLPARRASTIDPSITLRMD
jgi:putative ABC transport system permease protein